MERKTTLIVEYSQKGHYMYNEDTWCDSVIIENEKDLLIACKEWHKRSASNFNDYPFGGLFSFNNISFQKQNIIIDDNGELFYGKIEETNTPEYLESVKDKFNSWIKFIRERLPKLREARKKRLKDENERRKFEEISLKFGK